MFVITAETKKSVFLCSDDEKCFAFFIVFGYNHIVGIQTGGDYLITTDDRFLKFETDEIKLADPVQFVREWEVSHD